MNGNETQRAALEQLKYERSDQARIDRVIDRSLRAARDIKLGHVPECTLMKCAPDCKHK